MMSFMIKYSINFFYGLRVSYVGLGLLIFEVLNHTWTHHTWKDSSGQAISSL